jgi:hypothetical protein
MSILAIDPSSTAIGWAVLKDGKITASGVERPEGKNRRDKLLDIYLRCLDVIANGLDCDYAAIEIPAVHTHGRIAKAQGQAIYGVAVGMVIACAFHQHDNSFLKGIEFFEPSWKNRQPKEVFAVKAKIYKPTYDRTKDKGADEADAICLAIHAERTLAINDYRNRS